MDNTTRTSNNRKLVLLILLGTSMLALLATGLHAGATQAASPQQPPTPGPFLPYRDVDPSIYGGDSTPAVRPNAALDNIQRFQTLTLDMKPQDIMRTDNVTKSWPVIQEDVEINSPGGTFPLPKDVNDPDNFVFFQDSSGISYRKSVTEVVVPQPVAWFRLQYRTRQRVTRSGSTLNMAAHPSIQNGIYSQIASTLVYTRPYPPGAPANYWGYTVPTVTGWLVPPTDTSIPGQATWIANNVQGLNAGVTWHDPLFGSNLTVTQMTMSPLNPQFGQLTYFTITVANIGTETAARRFATELYIKAQGAPPPQNAQDHIRGLFDFEDRALFHKPGIPGDWPIEGLTPGSTVQLETTVLFSTTVDAGAYNVYAQVDTFYEGDASGYYAWYGTNAEGSDSQLAPPYPAEQNVYKYSGFFNVPKVFLMNAVPSPSLRKTLPGKQAVHVVRIYNTGNYTDTYQFSVVGSPAWPVTILQPSVTIRNGQTADVSFLVPVNGAMGSSDTATIHIQGVGDPAHGNPGPARNITLTTVADYNRVYMPFARKR